MGTLAIIGNGPSELNSNNGHLIDSHDNVLRFNNFNLKYPNDYRRKTTVWATTFVGIRQYPENIKDVWCPQPLSWAWSDAKSKGSQRKKPKTMTNLVTKPRKRVSIDIYNQCESKVRIIPIEYFRDLIKILLKPSTGISMLYWIWRIIKTPLNKSRVFGFNFFNPNLNHHYYDNIKRSYAVGHDGKAEKKLFNLMCSKPWNSH